MSTSAFLPLALLLLLVVVIFSLNVFAKKALDASHDADAGADVPATEGRSASSYKQNPSSNMVGAPSSPSEAEVDKMTLKQLRRELLRRGQTDCHGCLEKEHFRAALKAKLDEGAPILSDEAITELEASTGGKASRKPSAAPPTGTKPPETKMSAEDLASLKNMLKKKKN